MPTITVSLHQIEGTGAMLGRAGRQRAKVRHEQCIAIHSCRQPGGVEHRRRSGAFCRAAVPGSHRAGDDP